MLTKKNKVDQFVKEYYIKNAQSYIQYRNGHLSHAEDAISPIIKSAMRKYGANEIELLDLGCGFGTINQNIKIKKYIGIDISKKLFEAHTLRKRKKSIFIIQDMRTVCFNKLKYNFVIGNLVFNYIENPKKIIKNIRRKGVSFSFTYPNPAFDKKFAYIKNNKIVNLKLNNHKFVYYHHSIKTMKDAIGSNKIMNISYTEKIAERMPPVYVNLSGKW